VEGREVVLAAPSDHLSSTKPGGGYQTVTGTSNSTALIAGAAALVRARFPQLAADEVIHRLTSTADDKGPVGRDNEYGYGVINIVKALTADVPLLHPSAGTQATSGAGAVPDGRGRRVGPWIVGTAALLLVLVGVALLLGRRGRRG
jgi:subtilisin family serine protease